MIRIERVHKTFQTNGQRITALRDINIEIGNGEIFGIIGRSGAGKSTLIRTLNLLERPSSGHVFIEGQDIMLLDKAGLERLRQRVGMVFQHFNLLNAKTVAENVRFPLQLAGQYTPAVMAARVDELLDLVGLSAQRYQYPAQLSGGQKQRVGIARALANYPTVLLSDEATSALDPETTQSILRLLADINRQLKLTIVLITHEMQVIRAICDRVAILDHGELVESGNVTEVFLNPQHTITRLLLAEGSGLDAREWEILRTQASGPLLRLTFIGDMTYQPMLARVGNELDITLNILQGAIGRIKDTPYGQLVVELTGDVPDLTRVFATLDRYAIRHEVLC